MANTASARKNIRKANRNRRRRQKVKRLISQRLKARRSLAPSDYPNLQKLLDKAATRGIIKPNKARRLKSRLMRARQTR